jgi:microcin C transport system permease protein
MSIQDIPETALPSGGKWLSPLNQRRWRNFKRNRRAVWSLWIFSILFFLSLFAELIANDKPILVSFRGELRMPVMTFYSEQDFGGDFPTEAVYSDVEVKCLIATGGLEDCFDDPEGLLETVVSGGDVAIDGFEKGGRFGPLSHILTPQL